MRQKSFVFLAFGLILLLSTSAQAGGRPGKDWKSWFGHVAIGWSIAEGDYGKVVDDDFWFDGGATYWPDAWPVGINLDLSYSSNDVSSGALNAINDAVNANPQNRVTGGDIDIWSVTGNVVWGPDTGKVGFYLLGGVGLDYLDGKVTSQGLVAYPPVCGGWYWWGCYPGGVGTGTLIRGSESSTEFSYQAGAGITFELNSGSQIYLEGKYHVVTANADIEVIPLVIGWRW